MADDRSVWALAGSDGLVRRRSDGWAPAPPLPLAGRRTTAGVSALSKDDVWIGGTAQDGESASPGETYGFVAHLAKGAWEPVQRVPMREVTAIGMRGAELWVVGDAGAARWERSAWVVIPTPGVDFSGYSRNVAISGPDDVWLVGSMATDERAVMHWDGSELRRVHRSKYIDGANIWASSPTNVWVSGKPGMRFDGTSWEPIDRTAYTTTAIWGTGPEDVWLVSSSWFGDEGVIRHWDGVSFERIGAVSPGLHGVSGTGVDDVWFVGSDGATLRYDSSEWNDPR